MHIGIGKLVLQRGCSRVDFSGRFRVCVIIRQGQGDCNLTPLQQVLDWQCAHRTTEALIKRRLFLNFGSVAPKNPGGSTPPWKRKEILLNHKWTHKLLEING